MTRRWALVFAAAVAGCAGAKIRQACKPQCEDARGPVMSLMGGPTIPPDAWYDCMDACEAREGNAAPREAER